MGSGLYSTPRELFYGATPDRSAGGSYEIPTRVLAAAVANRNITIELAMPTFFDSSILSTFTYLPTLQYTFWCHYLVGPGTFHSSSIADHQQNISPILHRPMISLVLFSLAAFEVSIWSL